MKISAFLFLLISTITLSAQDTQLKTDPIKCVPTKECAEKMGMTLEECKAICAKLTKKECQALCQKMSLEEKDSKASSIAQVSGVTELNDPAPVKKSCCSSIKACAEKMGMTIEECKAKCFKNTSSSPLSLDDSRESRTDNSETKVATATSEAVVKSTSPAAKCCASAKACCKK